MPKWDDRCRLCHKTLFRLGSSRIMAPGNAYLRMMMWECYGVKFLKEDTYQFVCNRCVPPLREWYLRKKRCMVARTKLRTQEAKNSASDQVSQKDEGKPDTLNQIPAEPASVPNLTPPIDTENKPYLCEYCAKSFQKMAEMHLHVKRAHTMEKPFKCETCASVFATKGQLTVHNRCHTGERPYKCEYCLKGFTQKAHLKTHTRTHTGEKPYPCEKCDKRFTTNQDLIKHKKHHL